MASVKGIISDDEIRQFETGLKIEDYTTAPAKIRVTKENKEKIIQCVK